MNLIDDIYKLINGSDVWTAQRGHIGRADNMASPLLTRSRKLIANTKKPFSHLMGQVAKKAGKFGILGAGAAYALKSSMSNR